MNIQKYLLQKSPAYQQQPHPYENPHCSQMTQTRFLVSPKATQNHKTFNDVGGEVGTI
jgi:hypothetical protein